MGVESQLTSLFTHIETYLSLIMKVVLLEQKAEDNCKSKMADFLQSQKSWEEDLRVGGAKCIFLR